MKLGKNLSQIRLFLVSVIFGEAATLACIQLAAIFLTDVTGLCAAQLNYGLFFAVVTGGFGGLGVRLFSKTFSMTIVHQVRFFCYFCERKNKLEADNHQEERLH